MVLQMLDLLSSKKSLETRNSSENSKDGSSPTKSKDISDEFSVMSNLKEGKTIDMKEEEDNEEHCQKNTFR